jgi:selenocysteine lyase/cysteine desulfurase
LWESDKIMPRAAGDGIRQSLHIYNTFEDVDRTLARIRKMAANPPKGK